MYCRRFDLAEKKVVVNMPLRSAGGNRPQLSVLVGRSLLFNIITDMPRWRTRSSDVVTNVV